MPITTVAACKAFRGITSTEHDAELARLIDAVQIWLEQECGRAFERATVTEYYSGSEWSTCILVRRPPIVSVVNIWDDPARVYSTPLESRYYVVPPTDSLDAEAGVIRMDGYAFSPGVQNIKVTYVGGYDPIPADLEQAAIEMVWAAREKGAQNLVGVRSRSIADGSVQFLDLGWEALARGIVQKYRLVTGVT